MVNTFSKLGKNNTVFMPLTHYYSKSKHQQTKILAR